MITTGLVGGGPEGEYSRRSEILDLKNGNSYCTDWSPYVHDTEGSFGAFVNNVAIVSSMLENFKRTQFCTPNPTTDSKCPFYWIWERLPYTQINDTDD